MGLGPFGGGVDHGGEIHRRELGQGPVSEVGGEDPVWADVPAAPMKPFSGDRGVQVLLTPSDERESSLHDSWFRYGDA